MMADRYSMYTEETSKSLNDLIEQHADLVKRIAHHMMGRMPASVAVDDLIQAGMIGLIDASKKFDHSKGASFETYAGIRIRGAMIDELRKGEWAPRSVHRNARAIQEAIQAVENRTGRDASDRDVADELGIDISEYHAMLQDSMATKLFSIDEMVSPDEQIEKGALDLDHENPYEGMQKDALRQQLAHAITELPEREQLVLSLYYDEELNLKEIGEVLGVSESRVSQLHSQAAQRLRSRLKAWA
ncbi:MAG: RNA polymerase sigma factor FliA [Pseudomonadales bacterium]|nr:RNA polymerase sigma factor FliA [Pseudomonadales bacterium]